MDNKEVVILPAFSLGTLIRDGEKMGIIYREIKQGTWTEQPLFNWRINYEIYYDDGTVCVMGSDTLHRLIAAGRIEIMEQNS